LDIFKNVGKKLASGDEALNRDILGYLMDMFWAFK